MFFRLGRLDQKVLLHQLSFARAVRYNSNNINNKYYYEQPGNKLNPHTYFYRVLAVPFLKFCGIMIGTYYGMCGMYSLLENASIEETKASEKK